MPSCFLTVLSVRTSRKIQFASECERSPGLLAVDDPVVAVQHRLGAQGGEVGAGAGLAVALAPDVLAGEDAGEEALLLRLRAVADQQRAEHDDAMVRRAGDAVALVFLHQDELLGGGQAHAAMLARPGGGEPAMGDQGHVPGLCLGPVQAVRRVAEGRWVVGSDEGAHGGAEVGVGQVVQVHGGVGSHLVLPCLCLV